MSANTRKVRGCMLDQLVARLGDLPLDQVALAAEGHAARRLEEGLRPVSVNNELRLLRVLLNYAHHEGVLDRPARVRLLPDREREKRVKVWTRDQVQQLLEQTRRSSPAIFPVVLFLANTGCRRGEALALRWSQVDLERRLVLIHPSDEWRPKWGRAREVPISDVLMPLLSARRLHPEFVFPCRERGKGRFRQYEQWPQNQFDRARKAAGLVGGVHTLRHSFASEFLARRPDLPLLAKVLGHSDTATTRQYAHLLPDHLRTARNVVDFRTAPTEPTDIERAREGKRRDGVRGFLSSVIDDIRSMLPRGPADTLPRREEIGEE